MAHEPSQLQLQPGERLAQFVVHLARNADAFLLAHVLQIDRERAQLLVRLAKLLLGLPALGPLPGLAQGAMNRGHQPRQPMLEHVVGRALLERLDRHFLAQGAGDKNERCVGTFLPRQRQRLVTVNGGQGKV